MAFNLTSWREAVRQQVDLFARDPKGSLQRAGIKSLYGCLIASTMIPVITAFNENPNLVVAVLMNILPSVGNNLIANLLQKKYDQANAIEKIAQEVNQPDLAPAYELIAEKTEVFAVAEQALLQAGEMEVLEQLRDELQQLNKTKLLFKNSPTIYQEGRVNIAGGKTTGSIQTLVAGDQIKGDHSTTYGPVIKGSVKSGRDTIVGTNLNFTPDINEAPASSDSHVKKQESLSAEEDDTHEDGQK